MYISFRTSEEFLLIFGKIKCLTCFLVTHVNGLQGKLALKYICFGTSIVFFTQVFNSHPGHPHNMFQADLRLEYIC